VEASHQRPGTTKTHVFATALRRASSPVLDVGCGEGLLARVMPPGCRRVGVDRWGSPHVRADVAAPLPFRARTFAAAVCSDVFEHLVDPMALCRELRRVLKPDGLLYAHVPNEFGWRSLCRAARGRGILNRGWFPSAEEWTSPHLRYFSAGGFRRMLEAAGFTIVEDLTNLGRGWRRWLTPLFAAGPSLVARAPWRS